MYAASLTGKGDTTRLVTLGEVWPHYVTADLQEEPLVLQALKADPLIIHGLTGSPKPASGWCPSPAGSDGQSMCQDRHDQSTPALHSGADTSRRAPACTQEHQMSTAVRLIRGAMSPRMRSIMCYPATAASSAGWAEH
ncbi:hypothetical protein NDU88_004938 [Pleurodeles waltl]|uniref:Uncharacterized protein n=1 Tax=Pleurodeles waltl TaxID=8319 RepID=A0AAV7QGX8_PLEWA|nr:hypothetical protein NDU88_004938 [Pleurodeles waltl]